MCEEQKILDYFSRKYVVNYVLNRNIFYESKFKVQVKFEF